MKSLLFITFFLITSVNYAQQRKAAVIGLSNFPANVVYAYTNESNPSAYVKNGDFYSDSIVFLQLFNRIDSILNVLDFELISADSVIKKERYKELAAENLKIRNHQPNSFPQKTAKGYGYLAGNGLGGVTNLSEYFKIVPSADMLIDAYTSYDVKLTEPIRDNKIKGFVICDIFFVGYSPKRKKIIKFKSRFQTPMSLYVKPAKTSWGYTIISGYGVLQTIAFEGALKNLDDALPKEKARMDKFYSK